MELDVLWGGGENEMRLDKLSHHKPLTRRMLTTALPQAARPNENINALFPNFGNGVDTEQDDLDFRVLLLKLRNCSQQDSSWQTGSHADLELPSGAAGLVRNCRLASSNLCRTSKLSR